MNFSSNLWSSRLKVDFRASLVLIALLAITPAFISSPYYLGVLIVAMYFALLALSWNLLAGFTGQFSLAPAAFGMLGAYTPAMLDFHLNISAWIGVIGAVAFTALLGYLLGRIVLRLNGPYLALTTLAFAEVARVLVSNSIEWTRGDQGLHVPTLMHSRYGYYYLFLIALFLVLVMLFGLMRSRVGRFWMAIRDDSVGAESRGIDVVRYKTLAFAISCAICGLAGGLYGTFSQLASPELGLLPQTGLVMAMVVIGGMASLTGSIAGALIVYLGSEWLRALDGIHMIVFSAAVIIFARFFSKGLWGYVRGYFAAPKEVKNT